MTDIRYYAHQRDAIEKLHSGCILCGGVGTGKSLTALGYFWEKELSGGKKSTPLFIITTARKRDTGEWEKECERFDFKGVKITIDSWNNIGKYDGQNHAFFIFDEQRVVGNGQWVKSFLRIARGENRWLLLTATPGDSWMDYIPVFLANGFYKNRTAFLRRHAIYSRFAKYPKVEKWVDVRRLENLRREITVAMRYKKKTVPHDILLTCDYDRLKMLRVARDRWNPWEERPVQEIGELCYLLRRVCGEDPSRLDRLQKILDERGKAIVFYNFDYELDILKRGIKNATVAEWNGHKHEKIPTTKRWAYLVQYAAGAEGWNCTETDTLIFYTPNYSYKMMTQAAGRIDRINTPFSDLWYYTIESDAPIERSIRLALKNKKSFNEKLWFEQALGGSR